MSIAHVCTFKYEARETTAQRLSIGRRFEPRRRRIFMAAKKPDHLSVATSFLPGRVVARSQSIYFCPP